MASAKAPIQEKKKLEQWQLKQYQIQYQKKKKYNIMKLLTKIKPILLPHWSQDLFIAIPRIVLCTCWF
jgi:hypothetical protein